LRACRARQRQELGRRITGNCGEERASECSARGADSLNAGNVEVDEPETTAAPTALAGLRPPMLGRDDPSRDTQIDVMTEDTLLRGMKSLVPEEPSHALGDKDHSRDWFTSARATRAFSSRLIVATHPLFSTMSKEFDEMKSSCLRNIGAGVIG